MDGYSESQGTVLNFKAGTQKYTIGYHNGTTAELSKTQLMKILSPVLGQQAAPMQAAEKETTIVAGEAMAAGTEGMSTKETVALSGKVPSQFVELKLASNPVGVRVLSTPDH